MSAMRPLGDVESDEDLQLLFEWVDRLPLSRPKKNIHRDFADGVLMAEIIAHFKPKLVEIHNYPSSSNFQQKFQNWQTLNRKTFKKIGFSLSDRDLEEAARATPGAIERIIAFIRPRLDGKSHSQEPRSPGTLGPDLCDVVAILTEKNEKLEQLIQIKDLKIHSLQEKLAGVISK